MTLYDDFMDDVNEIILMAISAFISEESAIFLKDEFFTGYWRASHEENPETGKMEVVPRPVYDFTSFDIPILGRIIFCMKDVGYDIFEMYMILFAMREMAKDQDDLLRLSIPCTTEKGCQYCVLFAKFNWDLPNIVNRMYEITLGS